MATKKKDEAVEETKSDAVETVKVETPKEETPKETAKPEPADKKEEAPKKTAKAKAKPKKQADADKTGSADETVKSRNRAEKVGIVWSDKMMKTVVVRVDRTVKHPLYHKYMKRRKKFMAHDEMGAATGDRVRIVETRPLSARKRWRVVEILQKAEK